jgi:indolepyruvate ferredoxin oxidoreductase
LARPPETLVASRRISTNLDDIIARRVQDLTLYQNAAYADRYAALVRSAREAETAIDPASTALTEAVARDYYKLLAYKDEYEVARLYTETKFRDRIKAAFEGDYRLVFHLAPPLFAKRDPITGIARKQEYGPWMWHAFRVLAKLRGIRGRWYDPFAYTHDRKQDRALISEYEALLNMLLPALTPQTLPLATQIAAWPDLIRGFGHIRTRHIKHANTHRDQLLKQWHREDGAKPRAEEAKLNQDQVIMAG